MTNILVHLFVRMLIESQFFAGAGQEEVCDQIRHHGPGNAVVRLPYD